MLHSESWWGAILPATGLSMMVACVLSMDDRNGGTDGSAEMSASFGASDRYATAALNLHALPSLAKETHLETAATYEGIFNCTIYYTPMESGFTKDDGYDVTLGMRPGLKGRQYAEDFLRAVRLEGFGRISAPVDGFSYIKYDGAKWGFAPKPVDRKGEPLVAMSSSAIAASHKLLPPKCRFRIQAAGLPQPFINASWTISDTGGGLGPKQIDCYWGEDLPLGPGKQLSRPKGMPMGIVKPMVMVLK